ncbi:hypothetical protein OVS_02980 [Mycoplasma ovis str. Michigan]|uniref:Uncharacterized protein n=1 Tax=Mycoplasma ovis str. Michigan TaxID=1415773 RepID=A0ABM5P0R6_9MOLU|nr:DUF5385 family protein [Mycoplasma ovis]AHC40016.1 hypothetical protein OVS_02980 [Mycoplasma ovis str. Michigan]
MASSVYSLLPVFFIIGAFYFITKKRREQQTKQLNRKDDIWYVVKEYLKLSGRQGYKLSDLSLYPRAQSISTLREYIFEVKQSLKVENARLKGIKLSPRKLKRKAKWSKWIPFSEKPVKVFPKEERYHKKIELKTLAILSQKFSFYREYFEIYKRVAKTEKFQRLIKTRLLGEAISKVTKQKKKIISRNRYLVCFRTIDKNQSLNPWEAIEIELFKNPKKSSKEKYKILFTSALNYRDELHWIYAMQLKYFKNKKAAEKQNRIDKENLERKRRNKQIIMKLFLPLLTLFKLKKTKKEI